jgi:hypothetical protein
MRKGRRDPPGFMVLMIGDESQKASDAPEGSGMPFFAAHPTIVLRSPDAAQRDSGALLIRGPSSLL